jgi:hypothetical protein
VRIQKSAPRDEFLESITFELKTLKAEERRLQRAHGKVRRSPMLLTQFWNEMVALRQRADRLDAALDPIPLRQPRNAGKTAFAAMENLCA